MVVFDYIYYRIAKFFYTKDGNDAVRALGFIVVIQGLLLIGLFFLIQFGLGYTSNIVQYSKIVGLGLMICLGVLNYMRYKGKYEELADKWSSKETRNVSFIRGVFVFLAIILPYIFAIWAGLLAFSK